MDDIKKFLATQRISDSLYSDGKTEWFVDGNAIGMSGGQVPCILDGAEGQSLKITVADGPYTGMAISVDPTSVTEISQDTMEEISEDIF
jgi:hypothetical protein